MERIAIECRPISPKGLSRNEGRGESIGTGPFTLEFMASDGRAYRVEGNATGETMAQAVTETEPEPELFIVERKGMVPGNEMYLVSIDHADDKLSLYFSLKGFTHIILTVIKMFLLTDKN